MLVLLLHIVVFFLTLIMCFCPREMKSLLLLRSLIPLISRNLPLIVFLSFQNHLSTLSSSFPSSSFIIIRLDLLQHYFVSEQMFKVVFFFLFLHVCVFLFSKKITTFRRFTFFYAIFLFVVDTFCWMITRVLDNRI